MSDVEVFDTIEMSNTEVHSIVQKEAFSTLDVMHDSPRVQGMIKLKVDTGADGNTLPLRTYQQMFKDFPLESIITPEPNMNRTVETKKMSWIPAPHG